MKTNSRFEDIDALVSAMGQLLDDMSKDGLSVCRAAKAQARIAYEVFAEDEEKEHLMPLDEARRILKETS